MNLNIEQLRKEAEELLKDDPNALVFRSCWNCNPAHEHLKQAQNIVINCFQCGNFYYKGENMTEDE